MYGGSAGRRRGGGGGSGGSGAGSWHAAPSPPGTRGIRRSCSLGSGRVLGGERAGQGVRREGKGEEDLADG